MSAPVDKLQFLQEVLNPYEGFYNQILKLPFVSYLRCQHATLSLDKV